MKYPEWWERLVAAIIDGLIFAVVSWVLTMILVGMGGGVGIVLATLITTALMIAYKVIFESSEGGATPGKMVFGLRVVDNNGKRVSQQQALMRTWPWWFNLIVVLGIISWTLVGTLQLIFSIAIILIFCSFFIDPKGRCLHDQTADCNVIKVGKGMIGN